MNGNDGLKTIFSKRLKMQAEYACDGMAYFMKLNDKTNRPFAI